MTASTVQDCATSPAHRRLGRPQVLAGVIALLLANAAAAKILQSFAETGAAASLSSGLGVSWTYWLACAACLRLAWTEAPSAMRAFDVWLCVGCVAAAVLPISQFSGLACTGLALTILLDRSQGERIKGAAMVLMACSFQAVWSKLLMLFFIGPLAWIDAHAVGLLIQHPVHGNEVQMVTGTYRLSILGACTSVQNASLALMLYVAIVRTFRPRPKRIELFALAGVFASVVAINYGRLVLMAQSLAMYETMHNGVGWPITEAVITITVLVWAVGSVWREILD